MAISSQGWRWALWYCVIFMAIVVVALVFFLEESKYTPLAITSQEVTTTSSNEEKLSKVPSANKPQLGSVNVDATDAAQNEHRRLVEIDESIPMNPLSKRFAFWSLEKQASDQKRNIWLHVYQPFQLLATFPAVMFTALQYGFLIAMLAILAVTQATLYPFEPYEFSAAGVGNMNIPPAIGAILGSIFGGPLNDFFIVQVAKRRKGIYEPETRLWLFLVPGVCMPIGLFMFGLTISQVGLDHMLGQSHILTS